MHLEPDEKNGTAYLEAVLEAKSHYHEYLEEARQIEETFYEKQKKEIMYYKNMVLRYESYWRIMDKWLVMKENKKSITELLKRKRYIV